MKPTVSAPDLSELAAVYDEDSRDVFVSLYVDLTDERHERALERRADEVRAALHDEDDVARFDEALEVARDALAVAKREPDARAAAAFASPAHDFLRVHALPRPLPTRLVLDSSPYVRPLARFLDENEPFALALLDGERAVVYLVDAEGVEKEGSARMDLIGRHKKGGMSQMRYQRHRQGRVDALLDEIAERIEQLVQDGEARRVVLAGPGQVKLHLRERLPERARAAVVAVEDVDFDHDAKGPGHELVSRFLDIVRDVEDEESERAAKRLRQELRKGELATTGAFAVVRAARDGRVELLLVLKDHQAGGAKCEAHQAYFEAGASCAVCGSAGTQVDLLNEAVEHAARSESRIEFVEDDDFLAKVGGVGALLRW